MRRWREAFVLFALFPLFVLAWLRDHGLRWGHWWPQAKQAFAKRSKDTTFRTAPFADLIIASTALPYEAKILCVGARNRMEPDIWRTKGYAHVTAVDLLPSSGVYFGDMHRLPFSDGAFDLVYCSHVVEHSFDGKRALAELSRVVRDGGWLFAAFPVNFEPNQHDRHDYKDLEGFGVHLPTGSRWFRRVWARETPTECAVLLRLEGKEVMVG